MTHVSTARVKGDANIKSAFTKRSTLSSNPSALRVGDIEEELGFVIGIPLDVGALYIAISGPLGPLILDLGPLAIRGRWGGVDGRSLVVLLPPVSETPLAVRTLLRGLFGNADGSVNVVVVVVVSSVVERLERVALNCIDVLSPGTGLLFCGMRLAFSAASARQAALSCCACLIPSLFNGWS